MKLVAFIQSSVFSERRKSLAWKRTDDGDEINGGRGSLRKTIGSELTSTDKVKKGG